MRKLLVVLAALGLSVGCGKSTPVGAASGSSGGTTAGTGGATTTTSGSGSSSGTTATASSSGSTAASTTAASSSSGSGSGSTGSSTASSSGSSGTTTGSPVTLEAFRERVLVVDGGPIIEEPVDISRSGLVALVPDDVNGTYQEIRGAVSCSAGSCATPAIPSGDYFLVLDKLLVETTARTVDLRFARLGRANPALATQPTPVTFNLTNLAPAQSADRVELSDLNAVEMERRLQDVVKLPDAGSAFTPGETAITGQVDWNGRHQVLHILGDPLFVSQLSYSDGGTLGRTYTETQVRYQDLSGQDIADGVPTTITGALVDVSGGSFSQLALQWSVDAPAAFSTALPSGYVFDRVSLTVGDLPHYGKFGLFNANYAFSYYQQVADSNLLPLTYNQPLYLTYPAYWTAFVQARGIWYKPIALSAQPGGTLYANSGFVTADAAIATGTDLSPTLGVPRNLKVNGMATTAAATGVTATPAFTWDPPAQGTPQYYEGTLYQVSYDATLQRVDFVRALAFIVPATRQRFVVPPAFALTTGNTYLLDLRAIDTGTNSSTLQPKTPLTERPYAQPVENNVGFIQSDLISP